MTGHRRTSQVRPLRSKFEFVVAIGFEFVDLQDSMLRMFESTAPVFLAHSRARRWPLQFILLFFPVRELERLIPARVEVDATREGETVVVHGLIAGFLPLGVLQPVLKGLQFVPESSLALRLILYTLLIPR